MPHEDSLDDATARLHNAAAKSQDATDGLAECFIRRLRTNPELRKTVTQFAHQHRETELRTSLTALFNADSEHRDASDAYNRAKDRANAATRP